MATQSCVSLQAEAPEENIGLPLSRYNVVGRSNSDVRRHQITSVEADMSIAESNTNRLQYSSKTISNVAFSVLGELRQLNQLVDVTIKVGDSEFPVHRVVLAATSPYFRGMFTGV